MIKLTTLLLSVSALIGCTPPEPKNTFKPVIVSNSAGGSVTDGVELRHKLRECIKITHLGYIKDQPTFDKCAKHFQTPKYKIGHQIKFKDPAVHGVCVYTITRLIWSHGYVMNKPGYEGDQKCTHLGRMILFIGEQFKSEEELDRRK